MTRDDVKTILNHSNAIFDDEQDTLFYEAYEIDVLTDRIFDDFESRTCDRCKYSYKEGDELFHCGHPDDDMMVISHVPLDFGCNKWEVKE